MAIERVKLVNIVVPRMNATSLLKELVLNKSIEFLDAKKMIDETVFTLRADEEHLQELLDINQVSEFTLQVKYIELRKKLKEISEMYDHEYKIDSDYLKQEYEQFSETERLDSIYEKMKKSYERLRETRTELDKIKPFIEIEKMGLISRVGKLLSMNYFITKIGSMESITYNRISNNVYNIPGIFVHLASIKNREYCLFAYPKEMTVEINRILNSVRFEEIELDKEYSTISSKEELYSLIEEKEREIRQLQFEIDSAYKDNEDLIIKANSMVAIEDTIMEISDNVTCTDNFVYISIWALFKEVEDIKSLVEKKDGMCIVISSAEATKMEKPPTLLKNNKLFKPFESIVELYAVPSYTEIDPTPFFAVFYMLLFGLMFGDLGQGFIFLLIGAMIKNDKSSAGAILVRIGFSSMFFGFIYDSLFGYEHVISKLIPIGIYIRPFENQTSMLIGAVILGQVLLVIGYTLGIINATRQKDYENAFLGKNGVAGFCLYTVFIFIVIGFVGYWIVPQTILYIIGGLSLLALLTKQPLYSLLTGRRPFYSSKKSDYYVEHGFELFETILGLLSNSLSFIRVGAFALNHVGLFIAFHTISQMLNSSAGNIIIAILANVIILVLEGLIVSIQGLRLMYYEFFSKYFVGDGRLFKKVELEGKK